MDFFSRLWKRDKRRDKHAITFLYAINKNRYSSSEAKWTAKNDKNYSFL